MVSAVKKRRKSDNTDDEQDCAALHQISFKTLVYNPSRSAINYEHHIFYILGGLTYGRRALLVHHQAR